MSDHLNEQSASGQEADFSKPPLQFHFEEVLAALIMAVLCLITIANVLTRYFTNVSFAFTEEISVFFIVALTFIGTATGFSRKKHLAILFVVKKFPVSTQRRIETMGIVAAIITFSTLAWYGALMCLDDFNTGMTSPGLGISQWIYTATIPLLSLLVVYRLLVLLIQQKNNTAPFGGPEEQV
jgi:TRAP-type C4-dicarboxylate transport system permease small subunit